MRRVAIVVLVLGCLLSPGAAALGGTATESPSSGPHIVAVAPNPVADGDVGEFVVLDTPRETNLSRYELTDGEETVRLPNRTVEGEVLLTAAPDRVRNRTDRPVLELALPALSNAGERLRLLRGNRTVSTLRYTDAPEGERWRNGTWTPAGATDYSVARSDGGTARAFVLPDATGPPIAPIRNATERVWLAGYTLTSGRVTDALVAAAERGADVRVLLEGGPVGGISRRQATRLDTLTDAGVAVRVVTGPHARYAYHHAKYAVADDRAVVLTENWKPAGVGGGSSRGWGAVVTDPELVAPLARTFEADFSFRAATGWDTHRRGRTFVASNASRQSYPTAFAPERLPYERASLLVAPDNARNAVLERLQGANESIRIVQMSVGPESAFLDATLAAARRGVEVRVLLSGAWYVREENTAVVERLNALADREGLGLEARLAVPAGYGKIHAKGIVADDTVVLGSMNWNTHAATENREVLLSLSGERVAGYYREVFAADWRASGSRSTIPVGIVTVLAAAALVCLLAARRLTFE